MSEVNPKDFVKLIRSKYKGDPFAVSGFAFWKIEKQICEAATYHLVDSYHHEALYAVTNGKLVFYWSESDAPMMIHMDDLKEMKLLNLHHRFGYAVENLKDSHNINAYCPLSFEANPTGKRKTNDKIRIVTLNPQNPHHLAETANIINESTQGNLTTQSIKSWTETGVFDPELWLGAIAIKSNSLVGIGISTHNPSVKETDLDWFYIRKDHQGEGIGTMLVQETISRCRGKSRVIRVAGIADEFYIKCGFVRRDTWYYLTKKSSHVGWWD